MIQRLDLCIDHLNSRKKALEKVMNAIQGPNYPFFPQSRDKKLNKMKALLIHLQNYKTYYDQYIKKEPENAAYYNLHLEHIVTLLEKIQTAAPSTLKNEDFLFIPPALMDYKKPDRDIYYDHLQMYYKCALWGGAICAGIGFTAGIIATLAALGASGVVIPPSPDVLGVFLIVGAILGALTCGVVGLVLGFLTGLVITPFIGTDSSNPFIKNELFNSSILQSAYVEYYQVTESEKNKHPELLNSLDQPSFAFC